MNALESAAVVEPDAILLDHAELTVPGSKLVALEEPVVITGGAQGASPSRAEEPVELAANGAG
jgi:hypothetical protein